MKLSEFRGEKHPLQCDDATSLKETKSEATGERSHRLSRRAGKKAQSFQFLVEFSSRIFGSLKVRMDRARTDTLTEWKMHPRGSFPPSVPLACVYNFPFRGDDPFSDVRKLGFEIRGFICTSQSGTIRASNGPWDMRMVMVEYSSYYITLSSPGSIIYP
jgi:hypothetical protein